jgi:hypothetical protein
MVSKEVVSLYPTEGLLGADFPGLGVREHLEMLRLHSQCNLTKRVRVEVSTTVFDGN